MNNDRIPRGPDPAMAKLLRQADEDRIAKWNIIRRACIVAGSILFILGIILTPIHKDAEAEFEDELEEYTLGLFANPLGDDDAKPLPIPSWFVTSGDGLAYILQWTGILLLLWAAVIRVEK